jgi:hypothetical protein
MNRQKKNASRTNGTFGFARHTPVLSLPKEANPSQNQKSAILPTLYVNSTTKYLLS